MNKRSTIFVVLGMHRSGTSAVTRGLQVLGIDLGNRLMPPAAGNNEKGFFEDLDIYKLNVALLKTGNHDWNTLSPTDLAPFAEEQFTALHDEAVRILQERFQHTETYGIKDPRIARLLSFWIPVFEELQLSAKYIIVVRNPISVAKSLKNRDGLPPEKSHYLWLEHLVPSLLMTDGAPRVVVDYDRLLDDPLHELGRIKEKLGTPGVPDKGQLEDYLHGFLEEGLRHTRHRLEDLESDPSVPEPVYAAARLVDALATDDLSSDDASIAGAFRGFGKQLTAMSPAFNYIDLLNAMVRERDAQVSALGHQVAVQGQSILERDAQVSALGHQVAVQEQVIRERDGQVATLNCEISEKTGRLEDKISEIGQLKRALADAHERLEYMENSLPWRLFRQVCRIGGNGVLRRHFRLRLIPNEDLRPSGRDSRGWESVGGDPYFMLEARDGTYPKGWVLLDTKVANQGGELSLKFSWDEGNGFSDDKSVIIPINNNGRASEVIKLPKEVQALKWSPIAGVGEVEQSAMRITEIGAIECLARMLVRVLPLYWKHDRNWRQHAGLWGLRTTRDLKNAYRVARDAQNYSRFGVGSGAQQ